MFHLKKDWIVSPFENVTRVKKKETKIKKKKKKKRKKKSLDDTQQTKQNRILVGEKGVTEIQPSGVQNWNERKFSEY